MLAATANDLRIWADDLGVPCWLPALIILVSVIIAWRRSRHFPPGHCQQCGYNLTGNVSGICPECGDPIER